VTDDDRAAMRAELASIAAALGAYVEWHRDAGTIGFPRRPWKRDPSSVAASPSATSEVAPDVPPTEPPPPPPPMPAPAPAPPPVIPPSYIPKVDRNVRLPQLAEEVRGCQKCSLAGARNQPAFARGSATAKVMFVGEAPGAEDDEHGRPMIGQPGQLLDRMMSAIRVDPEEDAYVCNVIKCRPPANRRPTQEEIASCMPYLHEQIALVRPEVIVSLGNVATTAILDTKNGARIDELRGNWRLYRGTTLVMPMYHPSRLLRGGPEDKEQRAEDRKTVWSDLQLVMAQLTRGK